MPDFSSCHAKLERAKHNSREFDDALGAFVQAAHYGLFAEPDRKRPWPYGYQWWEISAERMAEEQIPPDISAVLGDVLHDWRSALDHLAWQLAIKAGNDPPPSRTEFPIFLDADEFSAAGSKGRPKPTSGLFKMRGLGAEDQAAIERLQPYHAGEPLFHPLWLLQEFSILDKHRATPTTVAVAQFKLSRPDVKDMRVVSTEMQNGPFKDGAIVARYKVEITGERPQMDVDGQPVVAVRLDYGRVGLPIAKTLQQIRAAVESVVERLAR